MGCADMLGLELKDRLDHMLVEGLFGRQDKDRAKLGEQIQF